MIKIYNLVVKEKQAKELEKSLTIKEQLVFFLPLGVTQMLISFTHSLFNAALARLVSPEIYISAFAIAKSVLQLVQNPVSMVKQTVTGLIEDEESYHKVNKFIMLLTTAVVVIFAIFSFSGLSKIVLRNLMGVEGRVLDESVKILRVLILFPVFVSIRNFMQGIAIKFKMTPLVTFASIVRVVYVGILVMFIDKLLWIPGGILAGLMFLTAMMMEGIFMYASMKFSVKNIPLELEERKLLKTQGKNTNKEKKILNNRIIFSFFGPLLITAFIRTLARPIINAGLARTINPEMALASYAIAWGLGIIVVSPLMNFHQVPLTFLMEGEPKDRIKSIQTFAIYLSVSLSAMIGIMAFTPIGPYIIGTLIGAEEEMLKPALQVLKMMTLLPFPMIARQYYWGIFMKRKETKYISQGKTANLVALVVTIIIITLMNPSNSAMVGIIGMISAETFESLYLSKKNT